MTYQKPARATPRSQRLVRLAALIVVGLAAVVVVKPGAGHSTGATPADSDPALLAPGQSATRASDGPGRRRRLPPVDERGDSSGEVNLFDDTSASIANLEPDLRDALRRAALAAEKDGVSFYVTSGWRSAVHQQELVDQAVAEYGSKAEALKWVATPMTSQHVRGEAADIGHDAAIAWLSQHGADYDLCQVYRNEPWHYELRSGAADHGCPAMYADPTDDPRMQ